MSQLAISLLGPFQVTLDDEPITDFATDKARALLAYLAVEADRPQRRDALAELLWPEQPQRKARHSLRQALSHLRQALGDQDSGDSEPFLLVTRETVQFNPQGDHWLDEAAFTALIADCQTHRHRRPETCRPCLQRLEEAAALYRGCFLEGFFLSDSAAFEEWALLRREWLQRLAVEALSRLADGHERRGFYERARHFARRQVELEPWREEAHRQLMHLLALGGERSAALAQYETCRRALAEELAVEPTAETTALHERIRAGELAAADWGGPPPHRLPSAPTPFVGRQQEVAELVEMLADPACRLLTLVGPGGIGKSRLALRVAEEQRGAFAHGLFFVPLATVNAAEFLVPALADALGFSFQGRQDPWELLLNFLREKEMLLVLDSLEHLLDERALLIEMLRRAPGTVLLVTSRERLNLPLEWVYEVKGLSYPQDETTASLEGCSAVELFMQGARKIRRQFALSEQNAPQVVRICRLTQGMPLAIELAAASVVVCSPGEIAREIEGNLDFLSTFLRNVPPRHQSMRATFEHSWGLLAERERQLFAKLAVFRGGFAAEAAEQVACASSSLLGTLTDKSLLQRHPAGGYEMHALLKQYAAEKLAELGLEEQARDQHCSYYVAFLRHREQALQSPGQRAAMEAIGAEIENVRGAWERAVARGMEDAIDESLEGLRCFYDMRSWFREGNEALGRAVQVLEGSTDRTGRVRRILGRALARQGGFCFRLGRYEDARGLIERSVAIFRDLGEQTELASALISLGHVIHYQQGRDAAQHCYQESLVMHRKSGHLRGTAEALNSLGVVFRGQGKYAQAKQALEEALSIGRKLQNRWRTAFFLNNLGIVSRMLGEYQQARAYYQESLEIKQEFGDQRGAAISLNNLGNIAYAVGDYEEAERLHRESLALCQEIGDQQGVARSLNNLGMVAHRSGAYAPARRLHQQSLEIKEGMGDRRGMVHSYMHLGKACTGLGSYRSAREHFRDALETATELQAIPLLLFALQGVAELLAKQEKLEQALELLSLIEHHPASEQWTKDQATQLAIELAARLPPQQRAMAQARGRAFELETVVRTILQDEGADRPDS